jgi:DNA-binding transcriptional ArsR family regulator
MDTDREQMARLFRALADETRLRLLAELAVRGELTCGEFAALCACSNSTLSYHQRILSEAGLIAVRRAGQFRMLALQREMIEGLLPGFLAKLARTACGCDLAQAQEPATPAQDLLAAGAGTDVVHAGDRVVAGN